MFIPPFLHPCSEEKEERVNFWAFGHGDGEDVKISKQVKIKRKNRTTRGRREEDREKVIKMR